MIRRLFTFLLCSLFVNTAFSQISYRPDVELAWPGASTTGGRGGVIYIVDTLTNASWTQAFPSGGTYGDTAYVRASLRGALQATGARQVLIAIQGVFQLSSQIGVSSDSLTVYGQTAPGPWYIRDYRILIRNASNTIWYHGRSFTGEHSESEADGIEVAINSTGGPKDVSNHVFDHWNFAFASDVGLDFRNQLQDTYKMDKMLVNECFFFMQFDSTKWWGSPGNPVRSDHSFALGWGMETPTIMDSTKVIHFAGLRRSVFAHNRGRQPLANAHFIAANNYLYNFPGYGMRFRDEPDTTVGSKKFANRHFAIIGNVFDTGPWSGVGIGVPEVEYGTTSTSPYDTLGPYGSTFFIDNASDYPAPLVTDNNTTRDLERLTLQSIFGNVTVMGSGAVKDYTLKHAGAMPRFRLAIEDTVILDANNGTGRASSDLTGQTNCITSDSGDTYVNGGWPSVSISGTPGAGSKATWRIPSNPNSDNDGDGYTNLEEWIWTNHTLRVEYHDLAKKFPYKN